MLASAAFFTLFCYRQLEPSFFLGCTNKVINWQRLEPYATGTSTKLNGHSELKTVSSGTMPLQNDTGSKANIGRPSVLQNSENNLKASSGRLSVSQNSDSALKEAKSTACMFLFISFYTFFHLMVKAFRMPHLSFTVLTILKQADWSQAHRSGPELAPIIDLLEIQPLHLVVPP
jgi:hypothetical protein